MYRIRFDAALALWVIELSSGYGLWWKRIVAKEFETLAQAESYVGHVGIDQAYQRRGLYHEPTPQEIGGYQPLPYVVRTKRA